MTRPLSHVALVRAALALVAATSLAAASPAAAQSPPAGLGRSPFEATTLDLSAEGKVKAAPDIAYVALSVTSTAPTAAAASAAEAQKMTATLAVLKARGIEAKDIQTAGLSLNPQYEFPQNQPRRLTGYQATNRVNVTVRDLARTGAVIDAVVAAGANGIDGISFDLADPKPLQDEARRRAVRALSDKAQLYAGATGMHLARLVSLAEGSDSAPPPQPMFKAMAARSFAAEATSTPVESGEIEVRVTLAATYELTR